MLRVLTIAHYLLTPLLASGSPFIHVQKEATFIPAAPVADITQSTLVQDKVLYYHIGDIEYFTPYQNPSHTLFADTNALQWSPSFEPIAVLSIPFGPSEGVITDQHIRPLVQSYLEQDDVLASKWFKTVYLRLTMDDDAKASFEEQRVPLDTSALTYLNEELGMSKLIFDQGLYLNCHGLESTCSSPGISLVYLPSALKTNEQIIAGPYLAHRRDGDKEIDLFPVSRLYSDTYHTFVMGVYPLNDGKGTYKPLDRVDDRGRRLIAVPSKLYALESNKSLAGVRTAIKDIYDIRGLRTTAGSRAYGAWKGIADETAPSIEILQEGGAVIVGKTKLAQFVANGQSVETSYDDLYPYSPRGDQGQSCGGSSSGSACALAAYDWLDFTVGSDTGGSIRGPAAILGLYGNRATHGLLSLKNVVPLLTWSDTAGIFARSAAMFQKVLTVWYADSQANRRHNHLPNKILLPSDDLPMMPNNIKEMVMKFVHDTERIFGMEAQMINMTEAHPPREEIMSLQQFDEVVFAQQWRDLGKPFAEAYEKSHNGRFPPVRTFMREQWHMAENCSWTSEKFDEYRKLMEHTGDWFNGLMGRDEETCSKAILMEPMALNELPVYREREMTDMREPLAQRVNPILADVPSSIAGCPHYVVPIGQVPFKSLVSEQEEMQTVSMSLIAYPGCDFMLLDLITKLNYAGVIQDVKTGLTAF